MSRGNQLLHSPHRCGVKERVVHHEYLVLALSEFDQFENFPDLLREGLFDQNMLAGLQGLASELVVSGYGGRQDHRVDAGMSQYSLVIPRGFDRGITPQSTGKQPGV